MPKDESEKQALAEVLQISYLVQIKLKFSLVPIFHISLIILIKWRIKRLKADQKLDRYDYQNLDRK